MHSDVRSVPDQKRTDLDVYGMTNAAARELCNSTSTVVQAKSQWKECMKRSGFKRDRKSTPFMSVSGRNIKKVKGKGRYSSSWEPHLRATGRHLPYGITQCYLPPDTSERAPPNPSHAGWYSIYLPRRDGRLS